MSIKKVVAGAFTVVGVVAMSASASFAGSGHVTDAGVKHSKITICVNGTQTMLMGEEAATELINDGTATKGACANGVE